MAYLPLNNYKYDSGYRRIQTGPDHEQFIVLTSGSSAYGADNGVIVDGSPLSGTTTAVTKAWDYDNNWRYIATASPNQSGSTLDPTPYNASGALGTYNNTRIATKGTIAGAQAANAIGPEAGVVRPRGGALQPGSSVTQPEKYMYFGGAAPDNQNYSPYNTPDANTAAEGKTGGPVTHGTYENTLITNTLGSQGTSDRSQWRYHQPVYCKTYTETVRSDSPGLMSTPLRYIYRGGSTSYTKNYGRIIDEERGSFKLYPYERFQSVAGCGLPLPPISSTNDIDPSLLVQVGDTLTLNPPCPYTSILWFNTSSTTPVGSEPSYIVKTSDTDWKIYVVVTYPDGSTDSSSLTGTVKPSLGGVLGGGYLGGFISHTANGIPTHALIVGPFGLASTGRGYEPGGGFGTNYSYKNTLTADPFVQSLYDGYINRLGVQGDTSAAYGTMNFCINLTVNGYTDWYSPSYYEMLILYFNLKPTTDSNDTSFGANPYSVPKRTSNNTPNYPAQTNIEIFQEGGSQAWGTAAGPRTSNENSLNTTEAYGMAWRSGGIFSNSKQFIGPVRAIRKIPV